jgi:hypothetical protein
MVTLPNHEGPCSVIDIAIKPLDKGHVQVYSLKIFRPRKQKVIKF